MSADNCNCGRDHSAIEFAKEIETHYAFEVQSESGNAYFEISSALEPENALKEMDKVVKHARNTVEATGKTVYVYDIRTTIADGITVKVDKEITVLITADHQIKFFKGL